MDSNIDKINRLSILDVLQKLGYYKGTHYVLQGNNIRMKDSKGRISDGWIGSISNNRLYCKSGTKEGRFEGDIIGIIRGALNLSAGDAIKWAEDSFNIEKQTMSKKINSLSQKWNNAEQLSPEQIGYLKKRKIEFNEHIKSVFKNYKGAISSPIKTEGGNINAIQGRKVGDVDKKFRYQIEKDGDDGTGVFLYLPSPEKKVCFVVEGMTDFGTIAQAGVNVIGLVSATAGLNYLKAFDKKYELIYIPDADETGEKSYEAIKDKGIKISRYKLEQFSDDVEDLNDAWVMAEGLGMNIDGFLKEIYEGRDRPPSNIDFALKKAIQNRTAGSWKIGDRTFDEATGGVIPGSLMIINGFTGEGKTTTMDWIIKRLTEVHNKKVAYCSMDDDVGKMLAMFLGRKFNKNWNTEIYPNIEEYVDKYGIEKFDNFLFYDDIRTIDDFKTLVKEENVDVLIIDYIQIIQSLPGGDKKNQMIYASEQLQI